MGLSASSHRRYHSHHERWHSDHDSSNNVEQPLKYGEPPFPAREVAKLLSTKGYYLYSDDGQNVCDYIGPDKFTDLTRRIRIAKADPSPEKKYPHNIFGWHFGKPLLVKIGEIDLGYRLDKLWLRVFGEENLVEMGLVAAELKVQFDKEILIDVIRGKYYESLYASE